MATVLSPKVAELIKIANATLRKQSAVDAQTLMSGGDPAAMGGDPAAMGGDPAAAAGGGGAPPPTGGGEPPITRSELMAIMQQMGGGGAGGGGMGGGMEPIKPKIDVNVEIMQIKNLLARLCDAMGVQIPAADMAITSQQLTQAGMEGQSGGASAPTSSISPIGQMGAASPQLAQGGAGGGGGGGEKVSEAYDPNGEAYDGAGLTKVGNRAAALAQLLSSVPNA